MAEMTQGSSETTDALERRLKRLGFSQRDGGWADRYLLCEHIVDPALAR